MVRNDIKKSSLLRTKVLIYAFNGRTFKIVGRQVPMTINGQSIRADFVATRNNKVYVFEAKMNSGRLTPAQKASGVFSTKKVDMANTSMSGGGTIKTSKGSSGVYIDGNGNTTNATFHVVKYKTRI